MQKLTTLALIAAQQHFAALDGLKYRETDSVSGLEAGLSPDI